LVFWTVELVWEVAFDGVYGISVGELLERLKEEMQAVYESQVVFLKRHVTDSCALPLESCRFEVFFSDTTAKQI
jgi:hypothetical protein